MLKRLLSALFILCLLLGLLPAALAEEPAVIFAAFASDHLAYSMGAEKATVKVKLLKTVKRDVTVRFTDTRGHAYTGVIPAGKEAVDISVAEYLPTDGSKTVFTLENGEDYVRRSPWECVASPKGVTVYSFSTNVFQTYVGRQLTIKLRVENPGKLEKGTAITLRYADGTELERFEHDPKRSNYSFTYSPDDSWRPGGQLYVWVEGRDTPDASTLVAVGLSGAKTLCGVQREDNRIAFTMDAGSGGGNVPLILDILDQHNLKVTFFITGQFATNYPDYVRMISERGHEIANHSWSHPSFYDLNATQMLSEVNRTRDVLLGLTGQTTVLFRPPKGHCNSQIRTLLNAAGFEVVRWTHDSIDSRDGATSETSLRYATKDIVPGSIILTHVNADWTVAVLDDILTWYEANGFQVVRVSELLLQGETATDENGLQYLVTPQ